MTMAHCHRFVTNLSQNDKRVSAKTLKPFLLLVRPEGFEPPTHGFEVMYSQHHASSFFYPIPLILLAIQPFKIYLSIIANHSKTPFVIKKVGRGWGEKMAVKWISSKFKGVRYYEHDTRKHGIMPDKYFSIRYQANNKRHEEGLGWASEGWSASKAFNLLSELKNASKTGSGPSSLREKRKFAKAEKKKQLSLEHREKLNRLKFCDVFTEYRSSVIDSLADWKNYQNRYDVHIAPVFANMRLKEITTDRLLAFKQQLVNKGLAPATQKHILGIVRQVFNFAIDREMFIDKSPFSGTEGKKIIPKKSKIHNEHQRILTAEEEDALFTALAKSSPKVHDMALISLYSGLRYAEIAGLRWLSVDFQRNSITVIGKGSKERTVPMNIIIQKLLLARHLPGTKPSDLIFPSTKGTISSKISRTYPLTVKLLGLNDGIDDRRYFLTFHSLRHTFATRLAEAGTPLTIIRDLLGHRDLEMVSRYAKSSLTQAAERVAGLVIKQQKHYSGTGGTYAHKEIEE